MDRVIRCVAWLLGVAFGLSLLGWADRFHLMTAAAVGIVFLLVVWLVKRRAHLDRDWAEDAAPDSPVRSALFGAVGAVIYLAFLGLCLAGLNQVTWLQEIFYDRDRPALEAKLDTLAEAGNFDESVSLLRERLERKATPGWRQTLGSRLVHCLVEAGVKRDDPDERTARFEAAVTASQEHGVDGKLAALHLEQARQERDLRTRLRRLRSSAAWEEIVRLAGAALLNGPSRPGPLPAWLVEALVEQGKSTTKSEQKISLFREAFQLTGRHDLSAEPARTLLALAEAEQGRHRRFEARLQELKQRGAWFDAVCFLRAAMTELPRQQWPGPLDRWLLDTLVAWGGICAGEAERKTHYEAAVSLARQRGLDAGAVTARLQRLQEELDRRTRPTDLPPGSRAVIAEVVKDHSPPVLIVHVHVENASGASVTGLQVKDFRVTLGGKAATIAGLAAVQQQAPELHIVLALDLSGSMAGEPFVKALKGAEAFLSSLREPRTALEVLGFSDTVREVSGWGEPARAASKLAGLQAGGGTALLRALARGLDDLRPRKGLKRIVVFTDGGDSVGGELADTIFTRCRAEGVAVYAIGLKTRELDEAFLRKLAAGTGGDWLMAERSEDIVDRFRLLSRRLQRGMYRLAVTASPPLLSAPEPIEVTVGGMHSATATLPVK